MPDPENDDDPRHVRWLAAYLIRDDAGRLVIAPHAVAHVEQTIQAGLDNPATTDELLDQLLRLAQGAFVEGGEVELARALVAMVLLHPAGRARLEQSDKSWARFVKQAAPRAPVHDGPAPEGSVPLGALYQKSRW